MRALDEVVVGPLTVYRDKSVAPDGHATLITLPSTREIKRSRPPREKQRINELHRITNTRTKSTHGMYKNPRHEDMSIGARKATYNNCPLIIDQQYYSYAKTIKSSHPTRANTTKRW